MRHRSVPLGVTLALGTTAGIAFAIDRAQLDAKLVAAMVALALIATVAGIFYGLPYRWTGSVFAAAIVHALVDATWQAFFR